MKKLPRSIGTLSLLCMSVGGIVGSGWLFGPFYASQIAGPAAILSWIIGGILMIFIALTFAELATLFPVAGGMVRFLQFSHGPVVGFTMGWIIWLSSVVVAPIETLALLQYASNYLPHLMHQVNGATELSQQGLFVAAILMFIMCILNTIGVRTVTRLNSCIVFFKLFVPVITVLVLMKLSFHAENFTASGGFAPFGLKSILSALPAAGVIFSFIGYSPAIQLAGESQNPQRAIPFAIVGSLIICIFLYVLIQIAFIGVLNPLTLAVGWQHLAFAGDKGPFAGIAAGLGITWLVAILYTDAAISPFGTALIYTTSTARINYALSHGGYLPKLFMYLTRRGVPIVAIAINFVIGLLFFLPFPGWQGMVKFLVSAIVIGYSVGPLALLPLRKKFPHQPRAFRLPAAWFFTSFAFYICNLIIFWTGWNTVWHLLLMIALGYVVFILQQIFVRKNDSMQWQSLYWLFPYLCGVGLISYIGSFGGGKNIIPFGWDFLVLAIFSCLIFLIAMHTSTTDNEQAIQQIMQQQ